MNSDYLTRSDVIYIYSYCDKCVGIICFYKILSIQIKWHSVTWMTCTIFYLLSCATKPVSRAYYCKGSNFIEDYIYLQLTAPLLFNM